MDEKKESKMDRTDVSYGGGVKWYREKIAEMINQIDNERFLKAIYISMSDYIKENEPD